MLQLKCGIVYSIVATAAATTTTTTTNTNNKNKNNNKDDEKFLHTLSPDSTSFLLLLTILYLRLPFITVFSMTVTFLHR